MNVNIQSKLYKIVYGITVFEEDSRKKPLKNVDSLNMDSINIIATHAYEALEKAENITLQKEKKYLKDSMQLFVQSVEYIDSIDTL